MYQDLLRQNFRSVIQKGCQSLNSHVFLDRTAHSLIYKLEVECFSNNERPIFPKDISL